MNKKNIALVTGGDSGEYVISVKSAKTIREHLDKTLFNVYTIVIRFDKWVYVDEDENEWPVDKNDFSIEAGGKKVLFDCVFITIHGTPGEDGRLQAYFDLLGIPYTTAGVMASALTFNKYYCNLVVKQLGYAIPRSVRFFSGEPFSLGEVIEAVSMPVFVKPTEGGSSLGMTFVNDLDEVMPAIELAFQHDDSAIVEEYVDGLELTCGVYKHNYEIKSLPVTEIISKTAARYFDYEAKYTPGAADEITPARISDALTKEVQLTSEILYEKLGMSGLVRFDYIHSGNTLYFIEVNVTPGMTETSLVPQAAEVAGLTNKELFTILINEAMKPC